MSIAIVGLGSVGRRHARNLLALGRADLVLVRTGLGQAGELEPELAGLPSVRTLREAVDAGATAVVVANPTALHAATALEAVEGGCHVLVEKPVSHDASGVDALAAAAARQAIAVLVGYQFRFHPVLGRLRQMITDGRFGDLVSVRAHWGEYLPGWHPEEDYRRGYSARSDLGGGVLRTLSHPIDYLRWLAGEVVDVAGFAGRRTGLDLDVDDTASMTLRFASSALGTVTLDYAERPARHELHVTGTTATAHLRFDTGEAVVSLSGSRPETVAPPAGFQRNDMFVDEMRHFLACCDGIEEPRCTLHDGARALEIALAVEANGGE